MAMESSVDTPDTRQFFNLSIAGGSSQVPSEDGVAGLIEHRYKMNHPNRGTFIIINNKTFEPQTRMGERTGTDVDASNLKRLFEKLQFRVERYDNLKAGAMFELMKKAGREDHSNCDCFGVAVLSHGEQGILFGTDDTITIETFIAPIKKCNSLAGKPKLFFFQACRGSELDHGVEVVADAEVEPPRMIARIPQEADFLFAYSTTPGYFSWRNSNKGSWFVQALYRVFSDLAFKDIDILRMLTHVNRVVAYEFESNAAQAHMTRKKQVPSIVSQLTKDLYFTRK